jgi:hypothetical protein
VFGNGSFWIVPLFEDPLTHGTIALKTFDRREDVGGDFTQMFVQEI